MSSELATPGAFPYVLEGCCRTEDETTKDKCIDVDSTLMSTGGDRRMLGNDNSHSYERWICMIKEASLKFRPTVSTISCVFYLDYRESCHGCMATVAERDAMEYKIITHELYSVTLQDFTLPPPSTSSSSSSMSASSPSLPIPSERSILQNFLYIPTKP